MKNFLVAGLLSVLSTAQSFAADNPPDWSGIYLGAQAGWGRLVDVRQTSDFGHTSRDYSGDGMLGGMTFGVNWQNGSWLLGLEGDYSRSNIRAVAVDVAPLCTSGGVGNCITEIDDLWTFRARAGVVMSQFLVYGTGGLAYGTVKVGDEMPSPPSFGSRKREAGWTLGAGVEAAVWDRWTTKIEYLYVDLPVPDYLIGFSPTAHSTHANTHIVRVGLNYRFGGK